MDADRALTFQFHYTVVWILRLGHRLLGAQIILLLNGDKPIDAGKRCVDLVDFSLKLAVEFLFFRDRCLLTLLDSVLLLLLQGGRNQLLGLLRCLGLLRFSLDPGRRWLEEVDHCVASLGR